MSNHEKYFAEIIAELSVKADGSIKKSALSVLGGKSTKELVERFEADPAYLKKIVFDKDFQAAAKEILPSNKIEQFNNNSEDLKDKGLDLPTTPIAMSAFALTMLFTKSPVQAAKVAATVGALSAGTNFATGEGGKKMFEKVKDLFGDITDNPTLGKIMGAIKDNPLTALALLIGGGYGFSTGKGFFGSIFEMGKWSLITLAVAWVAEHFLGGGKGQGQIADRAGGIEVDESALASGQVVNPTSLPSPAAPAAAPAVPRA